MQETWVGSLGWEDPLGKGKATHSNIPAWRIPWTVWGRKESDITETKMNLTEQDYYILGGHSAPFWAFLIAQLVKNLPTMRETWV